jgi:elongation factor Ts
MANITAGDVKALRDRTGLPMMDCKQALTEAGGDADKAVELLRKRGAAAAEKKVGRETAEGRIGMFISADRKIGALVELRCETAQVANNDVFRQTADLLARQVATAKNPATTVEELLAQPSVDNAQIAVRDLILDAVNKTRENIQAARFVRLSGEALGSYQHFNGQVSVLVAAEPAGADGTILADVCMQITAMRPVSVTRDEVPAEIVEKEREIALAQLANEKKPPQILAKIVDGKINKWFSERVLVEQEFVKDQENKRRVGDVLKAAGITAKKFVRLAGGETE